jgi:phosphate-selective porin
LTSEPSLDFAHRSLAARVLSPGRDFGVMAHGRLFGRAVKYQAGYFTRDGDNGRTSQTRGGENAVAGRLVLTPFASAADSVLAPLEIGVAVAESRVADRLGLRGRTVLGDGIIFDRVYVNGDRRRAGVDAAWASGPVGLTTEYVTVSDERKGMGFSGDDLPNIVATAWYGAGTWLVTGERKRGRVEPAHDFLRGGLGAIEVKARIESLRFNTALYSGAFAPAKLVANADRATTVGVNWYANHYVKLQCDVIFESIDDASRSPAPASDGRFMSTVLRLQFRF